MMPRSAEPLPLLRVSHARRQAQMYTRLTDPSRLVTADMLLPSLRLNPYCPCCEAIDEEQRKIDDASPACSLTSSRKASPAARGRRRRLGA